MLALIDCPGLHSQVIDIAEQPMDAAEALALVGLAERRDHYALA